AYGIVLAAGFFAPYSYESQDRQLAFAPPTKIHFFDANGRFHLRPFVYRLKPASGSLEQFQEDRSVPCPLHFLVPGAMYVFGGLLTAKTHLFGVVQGSVFLLGTDALGRDVFSRLLYGGQISLGAALLAAATSVGMGLLLGGIAGYYGAWIDDIIMRVAEVFLSVPWLYVLLAIRAFLPLRLNPGSVFFLLMFVSGLLGWARPARLVRGIVLGAKGREYVLAARGFGASDLYLMRAHVLPQAYAVSITQAALYIPQYITAEVTLSFFGLGVSEPSPSWGNMLAQLRTLFVLETCWWMFAPAVALVLIPLAFEWLFRLQLRDIKTLG
ncbi:MAG: ABC transporter permease, partial [Acidobacteriaceae bacterium]|nr:ABC transporter permease [Acidobacteriaceae bacterium]